MMIPFKTATLLRGIPATPGVYLMRGAKGKLLYVGKAANLKRRVASYFARSADTRIEALVSEIRNIDFKKTDTAIEALILESALIKRHQPPFNIREKDDTSFLFAEVTKEPFPRVELRRGMDPVRGRRFGPFTSASSVREALRIVRRIFPWHTHPPERVGTYERPCFDYQVGRCPGTCVGAVSKREYGKTVRAITLFFEGKKRTILASLKKDMKRAAKALEFERAEQLKRQVFALEHIQDIALITRDDMRSAPRRFVPKSRAPLRIEGYDISNISGTSAVGSMVVFANGVPERSSYRKFRVRSVEGADDYAMLKEVLTRRFGNNWPLPKVILVDGGAGQVSAARGVVKSFNHSIPVIGIAKGPERKRNDIIGIIPAGVSRETLIRVRDEAHRFAIAYHRKVRGREFLGAGEKKKEMRK